MELKIKKVRENAKLPTRATSGSAGMDLYACIDEPITLKKGDKAVIPTGIAIGLDDPHYAAFIYARSGLAIKHGIGLLNSVGVIDSDYRGEICVGVIKQTDPEYTIEPFERIAQMVIKPVELPEIVEVETLDETDRGAGGFGSTGTKYMQNIMQSFTDCFFSLHIFQQSLNDYPEIQVSILYASKNLLENTVNFSF